MHHDTYLYRKLIFTLLVLLLGAALPAPVEADDSTNTVSVMTGGWQPEEADVNELISSDASASDSNAPQPQDEHTITPHWSWTTSGVYASNTGESGTFTPYTGNYVIGWNNANDDTKADITFNGQFGSPGYYIVKVHVTVTYHDDTSNTDVHTSYGDGYLAGSESDIQGNSNAAQTLKTRQASSSGSNHRGIPVKVSGNLVITLDKTTVGITKAITGTAIATDKNGSPLSDIYITVKNSQDNTTQSGSGSVSISFPSNKVGSVTFTATTSDLANATGTATANVVAPTGEINSWVGWWSDYPSVGMWKAQLTDTSVDFSGITVTESDGGGGSDACYFPESAIPPFVKITEGSWTVGANNVWQEDHVGWRPTAVAYYRAHGKAPCQAGDKQIMNYQDGVVYVPYQTNYLSEAIGLTTVSSTRSGQTQTETYP